MSEHFIKNIEIKNYKLFKNFKAEGFGRVNLIGGKNNVGKTAFMEACYLSQSESTEELFAKLLEIRTHRDAINNLLNKNNREDDLRKLIKSNTNISIKALTKYSRAGKATVSNIPNDKGHQEYYRWQIGLVEINLDKQLLVNLKNQCYKHELNENTKFDNRLFPIDIPEQWTPCDCSESYEINTLINRLNFYIDNTKVQFSINYISNFSNSNKELENMIGDLKLNKEYAQLNHYLEDVFVINSMDIIKDKPMLEIKGNYLELSDFGQGIKSFINIIASSLLLKDSYLFIDEIENGIHYTNLDKLWEIILTISKEQNVQIFATTHSKECIESYARVAKKLEDNEIGFIELGRNKKGAIDSVVMDSEMFQRYVKLGNEVRGW